VKTRWRPRYPRAILAAATIAIACVVCIGPATKASGTGDKDHNTSRPLTAGDFQQIAPRGFGDQNNSWAQAMVWWHGALYVGTSRQSLCSSLFSIWEFASALISPEFANTWLPYPPRDPELSCAPDGADLALQAEIWRWTPKNADNWNLVFRSPLDLDNPGTGAPAPPRTGKKLPYEIAFRGLAAHTDPDGTEALYAFGVNSTVMWDRSKLPPPRILRSTDGLTFTPVPQTPGTFLGDLPFNEDHSSFRSPVSFHGKLFVIAGPIFGQGALIGSGDPGKGDDAWFLGSPSNALFYELAVFNDWLYLGGFDTTNGYSVVKTRATGPPPYQFTTVIPPGAYLPTRPSKSVVSMHEYQGRLYVGTGSQTEVVRINPDDTWDLVVGPPRQVPTSSGGTEWKYPLSGLDAGFGHSLNDHAWRMEDHLDHLYVGTYNASIGSKDDPVNGPLLRHNMGAHLYRSPDGWYYSAVTTNGFTNPSDPFGGLYDYGIRTMVSTVYGLFVGTANDHHGLAIFRATGRGPGLPEAPGRLEVEPTPRGDALLSWNESADDGKDDDKDDHRPDMGGSHQPDKGDSHGPDRGGSHPPDKGDHRDPHPPQKRQYQIWRAQVNPILVRDDLNVEGWNGVTGNKIPDTYVGPYENIGTSREPYFIDVTVQPGTKYMYYVVEVKKGGVSDASNLVAFPLLTPPVTFVQLLAQVDRLDQRLRFRDGHRGAKDVRREIQSAQSRASVCQIGDAIKILNRLSPGNAVKQPDALDLDILIAKLVRRLELFSEHPREVTSAEFCSYR
jgi:hypothetical protein